MRSIRILGQTPEAVKAASRRLRDEAEWLSLFGAEGAADLATANAVNLRNKRNLTESYKSLKSGYDGLSKGPKSARLLEVKT